MPDTSWKDLVDCDVQDKERLALFRAKLREWKKCLDDDFIDPHSIARQIIGLLWDDTVWRTFNEARRLSKQTKDPSTGLSGTLIQLIDSGFITRQLMAIRRLIEPHEYNPQKAVYSLRSLLEDIRDNQHLFTRENYVCYDGVTYKSANGEPVQSSQQRRSRQYTYDLISSTGKRNRQRKDKLDNRFIKKLERRFEAFKDLQIFINKFIAHASHPTNRPNPALRDKITLEYLDRCYKELVYITKGIELLLDDSVKCAVPKLLRSLPLKNWDKPVVTAGDKEKLCRYWSDREREVDEWSNEATDHYCPAG